MNKKERFKYQFCALLFSLSFSLLFTGCDKQDIESEFNSDSVALFLSPSIVTSSESQVTKTNGAITGTSFSNGDKVGLHILNSNNQEYSSGYSKVEGTVVNNNRLSLKVNNESVDHLYLKKSIGNAKIYGYYPYDNSVTDITKIPFDNTSIKDFMYATYEVSKDNYKSPLELNPNNATNGVMTGNLVFKHAMSLFTFRIKLTKESAAQVNSVKIWSEVLGEVSVGLEGKIHGKGTFNAKTGVVTSEAVDFIKVDFDDGVLSTEYKDFHVIIPPFSYEKLPFITSVKYRVQFEIDSINTYSEPLTINLKKYKLSDNNSIINVYGYEAGKQYIHTITLDNYIKFEDTPTIRDWGVGKDIEFES